jgi:hypothetical protein
MGDQQARAMGGSCLGGLLGLFLGGVAGGLWGWLYVGGATANDPRGVAILDIVNAVVFWIVAPFGTIMGGLVGGIVGAVCGAGIATRESGGMSSVPPQDSQPGRKVSADQTFD